VGENTLAIITKTETRVGFRRTPSTSNHQILIAGVSLGCATFDMGDVRVAYIADKVRIGTVLNPSHVYLLSLCDDRLRLLVALVD